MVNRQIRVAMQYFDIKNAQEFEELVRSEADIVQIIGEYVSLSKMGEHFEGRCPFHPEDVIKEICVYPHKRTFMCASANCMHGDVLDFVARINRLSRQQAIPLLAEKLGIRTSLFDEFGLPGKQEATRITFSMLKHFLQCPFRFKYKYIDGKRDQRTTSYLAIGRLVHNTLADFFRLEPHRRSLHQLLDLLGEKYRRYAFPNEQEAIEAKLRLEEMLVNYFDTHDCQTKTTSVEAHIECNIQGLFISGTVDRIDELLEGGYEIIDYKTEQLAPNEDNINNIQLAFYYFGVVERLHLPVKKLTLEYLPSQHTISSSVDEGKLREQLSKAANIVARMRETHDFGRRHNEYCFDCALGPTCPESQHAARPGIA